MPAWSQQGSRAVKNIFAYTPPGVIQPPYLSLNEDNDRILWLTVRGDDGEQARIILPDEQLQLLGESIQQRGAETRRRIAQAAWDNATKIEVSFQEQISLYMLRKERHNRLQAHTASPVDQFVLKIHPDDEVLVRDLPGYVPCEMYGALVPQPNEVGACEAWRIFLDPEVASITGGLNLESDEPMVCATRPNDGTVCEACQ